MIRQGWGGIVIRPATDVILTVNDSAAAGFARVADGRPTPERAAELAETALAMLDKLDETDPRLRPIALAKLEGCTNEEVATLCELSLRTVERSLRLIKRIWAESCPT